MITVGLDMSLSATGFARLDGDDIHVETIKTTTKTAPNDLVRIQHICREVMKRIPSNVEMICIEDVFMPMSRATMGSAMNLIALQYPMRLALYHAGYKFYVPAAGQLKKFATGKGNCDKSIVVREVFKRWGVEAANDNEADATTLVYMAKRILDTEGQFTWAKFQDDAIKKVLDERPRYNICNND